MPSVGSVFKTYSFNSGINVKSSSGEMNWTGQSPRASTSELSKSPGWADETESTRLVPFRQSQVRYRGDGEKQTFGTKLDDSTSAPAKAYSADFLESKLGFQSLCKRCDLFLPGAPIMSTDEGVEVKWVIAFVVGVHPIWSDNFSVEAVGIRRCLISMRVLSCSQTSQ